MNIVHGGSSWHVTISRFPDGSPQEIFLHGPKVGSDMDAMSYSVGVLTSFALQYGCPLKDIVAALPRLDDGSPADFITTILQEVAQCQ